MESLLLKLVNRQIYSNNLYKLAWVQYGEFHVIMIVEGKYKGYINATKLVAKAKTINGNSKKFAEWLKLNNDELLEEIGSSGNPLAGLMIEIKGGDPDYRGTFCHFRLIPHIASWASAKFAVKVSDIINAYIINEYTEIIAKQTELIVNLQHENSEKNELIVNLQHENSEKNEQIKHELNKVLLEVENSLTNDLDIAIDERVPPTENIASREQFCLMKLNDDDCIYTHSVIRCQSNNMQSSINRVIKKYENAEQLYIIDEQPNAKNLWLRIRERYSETGKGLIKFRYNNFRLLNKHRDIDGYIIKIVDKMNNEKKDL